MDVISDRAVVPRHCAKCDGLARLHIRQRTARANMRIWECPLCGWPNSIVGRWRYMRVERIERRRPLSAWPAGEAPTPIRTDRRRRPGSDPDVALAPLHCDSCALPVMVGFRIDRRTDPAGDAPKWGCPSCGSSHALPGAREVLYANLRRL